MLGANKIVVKMLDGRILKGGTSDFDKSKDVFYIHPLDNPKRVRIPFALVKAIFFVKTHEGRSDHHRRLRHVPERFVEGNKAEVWFTDGERIEGRVRNYNPSELMFVLIPNDPTGNNLRIIVNQKSVAKIQWHGTPPRNAAINQKQLAPKKRFNPEDYF